MKEFIEKLIGRLEEISVENTCSDCPYKAKCDEVQEHINDETTDLCGATIKALSIEIVNQLAEEYNGWWISADVELPKKNGWYWGYYVTSSYKGTDGVRHTECKYASIYWEDNLWLYDPRSFRTVDEVIAWKPIAPYQPKGE